MIAIQDLDIPRVGLAHLAVGTGAKAANVDARPHSINSPYAGGTLRG